MAVGKYEELALYKEIEGKLVNLSLVERIELEDKIVKLCYSNTYMPVECSTKKEAKKLYNDLKEDVLTEAVLLKRMAEELTEVRKILHLNTSN